MLEHVYTCSNSHLPEGGVGLLPLYASEQEQSVDRYQGPSCTRGDQSGERLSQHDHSAELAAQQGGTLGLREAAWSGPRPTIVLDFSPSPSLTQAAAAPYSARSWRNFDAPRGRWRGW